MAKMNPVVHFEMPAKDTKAMADFYSKVFGWDTQIGGPEYGGYVTVITTPTPQVGGRPTDPGAINGGFFPSTDSNDHPSVVIAVEDIKAKIEEVKAAGGKIIGEVADIPMVGLYISFIDPSGNKTSLLQPSGQ